MPVSGCDPNRSQDEKSMLRLTSEPVRIPTATTPDAKMTSYSSDELKEILRLHALWLDGNAEGAQANLCGADLSGANFRNADFRYANLRDADFRYANLRYADFRDALGIPIAEDAPARLLAVAHAALAAPDALEMGTWHTCETTHCICGWAEHLGGPLAKLIIQQNGNAVGGLMLLGIDAHAHFYVTNEKAREFLQSVIDNANTTIIAGVSA
jgi:hypothetical protein